MLDVAALRIELRDLEEQAGDPGPVGRQAKAQQVTSRLSTVQADLERLSSLRRRLDDLGVLFEMAAEEGDAGTAAEADAELAALKREIGSFEVRTLLSGEYDQREALVQITPGRRRRRQPGLGADAVADVLPLGRAARLPARRARVAGGRGGRRQERRLPGQGALRLRHAGRRARRAPAGAHLARSTTRPAGRPRFAMIDVTPVVDTADAVEVDEKEIRVDVFRSSGPGGQGVNTTDSAVRITHLPTGIVVSCQNERSQIQNRAAAMVVLQTKLLERKREEELAEMDAIRGGKADVAFGSQIRNYVLHPYQMVKDLRTGTETGNTGAVLDGEIDEFVEADDPLAAHPRREAEGA